MKQWINVIFISCVVAELTLVVCDYVFNYMDILEDKQFRRIWNIARESSIPTWFSSIQAQLLGVTVLLIAAIQKSYISLAATWGWVLVGLFFLFIGIDDFAAIHEKLGGVLERMATEQESGKGEVVRILLMNPSFSWHTFIAPIFALCGLAIASFVGLRFLKFNLLPYLFLRLGCWIIAQSLDFIEGLDDIDEFYNSIQNYFAIERDYFVPHTFKVVEEYLEMLGTTLLWVGFLSYFAHCADGLKFQLDGSMHKKQ
jgi:hypothetical protein